jgi:DNA-binding response OmpR family regulator
MAGEERCRGSKRPDPAEDDAGVRETSRQRLEAAFRDARPDLAITDIVMPLMEGLQTIRELRRERPNLPIIAISAAARGARQDFLEIARQLGVWEIVVEPFDPAEFAALVESCLARRGQRSWRGMDQQPLRQLLTRLNKSSGSNGFAMASTAPIC